MTTEITLGGFTVSQLKQIKASIQQDATAFIAKELERAQELTRQLISLVEDEEDFDIDNARPELYSEIESLAAQAEEAYSNVDVVAGVSGQAYYIPFYHEYQDERPWTSELEDVGLYAWKDKSSALYKLRVTLESMEEDSRGWNDSTC